MGEQTLALFNQAVAQAVVLAEPVHARARKRFGQHFLHDQQVLRNIASAMSLRQNQRVFEIGPGQGALTEYLFDDGLTRYLAVEIDRDLAPLLGPKFPGIEVLQQDILKTDLGKDFDPLRSSGWLAGRGKFALQHFIAFAHAVD